MDFYKDKEIVSFLKKVENKIDEYLDIQPEFIYKPIGEYISRGGKRIRPIILYLSARASNPPNDLDSTMENYINVSAIIEMFHNFTLIHDDIEDDSKLRRGKPTLHISHTLPVAINMGDALYTLVFNRLADIMDAHQFDRIFPMIVEGFQDVVNGQGTELEWYRMKKVDISEEEYFKMIEGKTASLISLSCRLGAVLSDNDIYKGDLATFGRSIGISFQIQDDILNLTGDVKHYKKEIGGDITEGKRTLMTAYAFKHISDTKKQRLKQILLSHTNDQNVIHEAIEIITQSGAIDYARKISEGYIDTAFESLNKLHDSKYKSLLHDVAEFFINRNV